MLYENFGTGVNILTVADIGLRYSARAVQNVSVVRQVVFSEDASRQLMDKIDRKLKESKELLKEDNGLGSAVISEHNKKLSGYSLSLREEENLLDSTSNYRIEFFRKANNLNTNFNREEQHKRLNLLSGCVERFYVEVLSQSSRARQKHTQNMKCRTFEDEETVPPMSSESALNGFMSWAWSKFDYRTKKQDVEANGVADVPPSDQQETEIGYYQGPYDPSLELTVDGVGVDVKALETDNSFKISVMIERGGTRYIFNDNRVKTLEHARALCTPESIAYICKAGLDLSLRNQKAIPQGTHLLQYDPLSGKYDLAQETIQDGGVD